MPSTPKAPFAFCFPPELPRGSAPLAGMSYEKECRLKDIALQMFWKHNEIPGQPPVLEVTPAPRGYRTTSKRRVAGSADTWQLEIEGTDAVLLEPESHRLRFAALATILNTPEYAPLTRTLNWIILRSNGHRDTVLVLNAIRANASLSRLALRIKNALDEASLSLSGLVFFADPERSDYYLDSAGAARTLFGRESILMQIAGKRLVSPVLAFTQVSLEAAGILVRCVEDLAGQTACATSGLLDIYCGYGLFSSFLGNRSRPYIRGIDISETAIQAARRNCPAGIFHAGSVSPGTIARLGEGTDELVILDPPRSGLPPGIIRALARREPAAVIALFCDIDTAPESIAAWEAEGYRLADTRAVDMFAGCSAVELVSLFLPAR